MHQLCTHPHTHTHTHKHTHTPICGGRGDRMLKYTCKKKYPINRHSNFWKKKKQFGPSLLICKCQWNLEPPQHQTENKKSKNLIMKSKIFFIHKKNLQFVGVYPVQGLNWWSGVLEPVTQSKFTTIITRSMLTISLVVAFIHNFIRFLTMHFNQNNSSQW